MPPDRIRQLVGFAIIAAGLIAVVILASVLSRCSVQREVEQGVALDRSDAVAEATNRVLEADRTANANQMERDATFRNQQLELKEAAREADTGDGVGNSTRAVLERLRAQQAAGRSDGAAR